MSNVVSPVLQWGSIGGAVAICLGIASIGMCGDVTLPGKPPPPTMIGSAQDVMRNASATHASWRAGIERDAAIVGVVAPGDDEMGWFAQTGRVPLGYFGDAEKTAKTFPVIDGVRWSVPGDRARYRADGTIEVLGRDSVTINSGGEKIFAEEVELALKHHPAVFDVVVAGRPSERWGQEVVAVVQLRPGSNATPSDLLAEAGKHLARYKLPKQFAFRDKIQRSPSGKADYRWAREQAEKG